LLSIGGGGGCSVIKIGIDIILVAAGGGGGGSTHYCCAHGGSGGGTLGFDGTFPNSTTPWPLTSSINPTDVKRRFEYTSSMCPDESGSTCISAWDVLPGSLPAEHKNLQYGQQL
jgi:hypothetical protein